MYDVEIKETSKCSRHVNLVLNLHMFYLELACIHMSTILQFTKSNYLLSYMTVEVIVCAHFAKSMRNEICYTLYIRLSDPLSGQFPSLFFFLCDKLSVWQSVLDSK